MSRAAIIGAELAIEGYGLAGAIICPADDAAQAREAWTSLPSDIAVVVLTADAAAALDDVLDRRAGVLTVVMPT